MKKNTILLIAVFMAAMVVTSCNKTSLKTFHLTGAESFEISYDGGSACFGIEANENDYWAVSTDVDWLEIKHTFGPGDQTSGNDDAVLMFFADRWLMNTPRVAHVTVQGPGGEYYKTITQNTKPLPAKLMDEKVGFSNEGGEKNIVFEKQYLGFWVKAECDAPWISIVKCEEGLLAVKVEANSGEERKAVVNILLSDGALLGTVTVTQQ